MSYFPYKVDTYGDVLSIVSGPQSDAFGRMRMAEPTCEFSAMFQYDTQPLLFTTSVTGTGVVSKTANESSLTLSTGGTGSGAEAINQTKQYFRYEPGKSQFVVMTGFLGAKTTNVRSRIGYFDANDGVFFEMDGTAGASVNQRTHTSGSAVTTSVAQASWNIDKMNGTGISGITIDFSKTQIFVIDLQWLGVGRVRFGFDVNGVINYCHQINNANTIVSPYMNTANLPIRAEITNTGTAGGTTTMKQVCLSAISEGGVENPHSYRFSCNNGVTTISAGTTRTPILSIRPKATFNSIANRSWIDIEGCQVYSDGTQPAFWEIIYNGTLTGASFGDVNGTYSAVEKDIAASACANGIVIDSGYIIGAKSVSLTDQDILSQYPFCLDLAGTGQDIYTLAVTTFSSTTGIASEFSWKEIR